MVTTQCMKECVPGQREIFTVYLLLMDLNRRMNVVLLWDAVGRKPPPRAQWPDAVMQTVKLNLKQLR